MDLRFTPEERAFREEVRAFIRDNLPADTRDRHEAGPSAAQGGHRALAAHPERARAGRRMSWPKEWGGPGWTAIQRMIFLEENLMAPAPELLSFNITMIGPVLIQFGTDEQKQRFLPRAANLDDWWCQGFSEPGAGSDLASLKTAAKLDGDHYVVNGQKIWTSTAHNADWCFVLVRTDPNARKRQEGISFLLVDMKTPGITVRPIISIDGSHHLNEVFFDDVRVPVTMRVHAGEQRLGCREIPAGQRAHRHRAAGQVAGAGDGGAKRWRARCNFNGRPLIEDQAFRQRVAQLQVDMKALEITQYRVVSAYDKAKGAGKPDPLSSVLKVKGTELLQATTELAVDVAGPLATPIWAQELDGDERAGLSCWRRRSAGDRQLSDAARRLDLWRHE